MQKFQFPGVKYSYISISTVYNRFAPNRIKRRQISTFLEYWYEQILMQINNSRNMTNVFINKWISLKKQQKTLHVE